MLSNTAFRAAVRTSAGRVRGKLSPHADAIVLALSAALLAYVLGIATGHFHLPPYSWLQQQWRDVSDWREHWRSNLGLVPTRLLRAARHEGQGVVRNVPGAVQPGVTLISSVFDDRSGLRLFDQDGRVIHTWPVSFDEVVSEDEAEEHGITPHTDWEIHVHGSALLPGGDVIMNVETGIAMVRMTPCGEIRWKIFNRPHHAIFVAEDGNIWTLGRVTYETPRDDLPGLKPPFVDDFATEVSPDGEILREISLFRVFYDNKLFGNLFPEGVENAPFDLLHTNDVEVLSSRDAPAFPLFEAGDVMVSFRQLSLVLVFDPDDGKVKWAKTGPWLQQHDPDFLPDGRIMVFDNRADQAGGRDFGGSRILAVDPVSNEVEVLYEGTEEEPFYTPGRGKVQALDNGNLLIAEPNGGRAFEVTPDGQIVWSFINHYDEDYVGVINGALRYPASYGQFDRTGCEPMAQAGPAGRPTIVRELHYVELMEDGAARDAGAAPYPRLSTGR